jgi:glycosyltransferase involved in cell wall biosynthesis
MPELSVIIPTHNRASILQEALRRLALQSLEPARFEVILVDDGSSDNTEETVANLRAELPYRIAYLKQPAQGPAAARNRALLSATGEWVLLLGDDILATPNLLAEHLGLHHRLASPDCAVLGRIDWDPALGITPLMRFVNEQRQFGFDRIADPENATARFFYSSNLSLHRTWLLQHGLFDTSFPGAAYEDLELGLRLERQGLRVYYRAAALAYHHHPVTLASAIRREQTAGAGLCVFHQKWPDETSLLAHIPQGPIGGLRWALKRALWPPAAQIARLANQLPGPYQLQRRLFAFVLDNAFSQAVQRTWRGAMR